MKKTLLLLLLSLTISANDCLENRAAFDIGSGSTKLKVAQIDTCKQIIIKVLEDSSLPVAYKQDLKESEDNKLSQKVLNRGIEAINNLKALASKYDPKIITAVATSAFRTSSNGILSAKKISRATGIQINIISQEKEAKIGFAGASSLSSKDLKNTVTWDIGGGSMQITSYKGNNEYDIYEGKLASVSFKNLLIEEVQGLNSKKVISPNPISLKDATKSKRDARIFAKYSIQGSLVKKIQSSKTEVIGIGGVHYHSIMSTLGLKGTYSKKDLDDYIKANINKDDKQLGDGKYVETSLSNFILVSGFMEAMNIKSIKVGKVNMADGLLIMPQLAKE